MRIPPRPTPRFPPRTPCFPARTRPNGCCAAAVGFWIPKRSVPPCAAAISLPSKASMSACVSSANSESCRNQSLPCRTVGAGGLSFWQPIQPRQRNPARATTIDDLARIATPSDPQISPDGSRVAYVLKTTDLDKNRYNTHIWVVPTAEGSTAKQWTRSALSEGQPRWSPDGQTLLFTSGRDEKVAQIFLLPVQWRRSRKDYQPRSRCDWRGALVAGPGHKSPLPSAPPTTTGRKRRSRSARKTTARPRPANSPDATGAKKAPDLPPLLRSPCT